MNTPVVWVLPEVLLRRFFWETTSGLFLYSALLADSGYMHCVLGVVLRPLASGRYLFGARLA